MFIEWRWSSLVKTLHWLLDIEDLLVKYWDDEAFGQVPKPRGRRAQAEEEIPVKLSAIIESPFFWTYAKMLHTLQMVVEQLVWWSESCPCHPRPKWTSNQFKIGQRYSRTWHEKYMRRLIGQHTKTLKVYQSPTRCYRAVPPRGDPGWTEDHLVHPP